jgi:transcriptional regulator with XRE-family HTH domain
MTGKSPTVRQRELGKRLRELRSQHALTVEDVAERVLCSATKISRLEAGVRRPSLRDVGHLCALYDVNESTSAELMDFARRAHEQDWWTQYEDLSLDPLIGLEEEAIAITCYSVYYVPTLLQTTDYAKVIIKAIAPKINPEILQQRVEVRLRRQQLLDGANRPRYRVLLDEAILKRPVGGPELMADQLDKVLEAARRGKVTVQVIPFKSGAHAAADGYFILLEFDNPNLSPVVFLESLIGIHYLERKVEIARYREAIGYLRDSALNLQDSLTRVEEYKRIYLSN